MFEIFTSLIHNYKSKIRNPFLGTLVSVWIIRNWEIVYAFFIFDKEYSMSEKISYIKNYFKNKFFWEEFFINIGIAFGVLIITYLLFAISRVLTDFYYKICESYITTKIDKKAVFTNTEKLKLENQIDYLKTNIERLRDTNSKIENQNVFLNSRINENQNNYDKELLEISEASKKVTEKYEILENKNIPANKVISYFDNIIEGLSESMQKELLIYIEHSDNIKSNQYKNFIGLKAELEKLGVITRENSVFKNTTLGMLFLEYYKTLNTNDLPF